MKFLAQKSVLAPALVSAKLAVASKPSIAIAGCFLLRLKGDTLEIIANDMSGLGINLNIQVNGEQNGEIAVSAPDFTEAVSNAPNTELTITAKDLNLNVSWGEERDSDIVGKNPNDFIKTPNIETDNHVSLKVQTLSYVYDKVYSFTSKSSENRPSLMGILFETDDSRLVAIGTDSHRFSRVYADPEENETFNLSRQAIVPPRAIQLLTSAAISVGDLEAMVSMDFSETHLKFSTPNVTVISKLLEGPYPSWRPIIPTNLPITITFNSAEMLEVLQRVNVSADKINRNIRLTVQNSTIRVSAAGSRNTREKLSCNSNIPEGEEPLHIGINASYLIEIIKVCSSEETKLSINDAHSLCVLLPTTESTDLFFLLMLIRLPE